MQECHRAAYNKEFASRMLFIDSYPLSPFPHGKGELITPVSVPMKAQAETAKGGLNENIWKTPKGVFPIFSFAREARRTAPFQGSYVLAQNPLPVGEGVKGRGNRRNASRPSDAISRPPQADSLLATRGAVTNPPSRRRHSKL